MVESGQPLTLDDFEPGSQGSGQASQRRGQILPSKSTVGDKISFLATRLKSDSRGPLWQPVSHDVRVHAYRRMFTDRAAHNNKSIDEAASAWIPDAAHQ